MVEQGHKVVWFLVSTRKDLQSPDLDVEGLVKPEGLL
jgi:hypothetical protein